MAHWICELFTFVPAFLYVAAGLEGKTWTEKKKKKKKKAAQELRGNGAKL